MAKQKKTTPGIYITEIDESVQTTTTAGEGRGAIVFKSNKGPVNQRIVTTNYDNFVKYYGEPENLDDYGHFAAENFLANSDQLLTVRATMGDESYAQIQYPYADAAAEDVYTSDDLAEFKFVNNELDSNLKILKTLSAVTTVQSLTNSGEWCSGASPFYLKQRSQFSVINDIITDNPQSVAVFKYVGNGDNDVDSNITSFDETKGSKIITNSGKYIKFPNKMAANGSVLSYFDDLILTNVAYDSGKINSGSVVKSNTQIINYNTEGGIIASGYKVTFNIPATDTLNQESYNLTAYLNATACDDIMSNGATYSAFFASDNNDYFYTGSTGTSANIEIEDASKIQFRDWDDNVIKTHYVETDEFSANLGQTCGIQYREYGYNDLQEQLIVLGGKCETGTETDPTTYSFDECIANAEQTQIYDKIGTKEEIEDIAANYGCDVADILTDKYVFIKYYTLDQVGISNPEPTIKVVYKDEWNKFKQICGGKSYNEWLFWTIAEKDNQKPNIISTYVQETPNPIVIPWQDGIKKVGDESEAINKIYAIKTSEILNGTNDLYRDGYTLTIESDDEPGIGDIELYNSNKNNQLIIASIGPGEYGNDVGVSIITTEAAEIPALNHQNAFNWKYRYDDEEQVDKNVDNLIWKDVYRINVYVKNKNQSAESVWGSGMDALLKNPVESFYVSNNPFAKDGSGNSLYAPNVINGHSDYIYVSRNSVNGAKTGAGTYAQPRQTYSIYQLTGGTNSKKNNMTEKTAALKLYRDRQKADFDILFNVEAIDTFNGKQRYNSHQLKIAEIAASRKMDIGVVQLTSKEAKTIKKQLGEAKMFSFNNGSYVAPYAGYDKYYNSTLGSWIYLPKSIAGACAMAFCDKYAYPWLAPAGTDRGVISYSNGQLTRLTDDELGQLYSINVNTSRECGLVEMLTHQKTALKKESKLNRINVRRCMNYIEKELENILFNYLFKQNSPNTRSSAKNSIDSFLSRVKAADGIEAYELAVTQDSEDEHIMNVAIRVYPTPAIEYIDVTITIGSNNALQTNETWSK